MRARTRALTLLIGGLFAVGLLAGCGDDSDESGSVGGDPVSAETDPQAVLDIALGAEGESIDSGVLDLSLDLQSDRADGISANASVSGPFESINEGELPSVDFDIQAGAGGGGPTLGFEGGVILTPDGLFISYGGSDYAVDDATFELVKDSYAQSAALQEEQEDAGSLSQFGIDPSTWLTDVTNEGEEDIDGTEVVHISGTADVQQIIGDLNTVAEGSGQAEQLDAAGLQQLQDSVQSASVDVYAAAENGSLRRLDLTLDVANPAGGGSTDSVAVSIGVADPNSDQEISAPDDVLPISELLGQFPGAADPLGGLAPGAVAPPAGGAGATGGDAGAYYECVADAPTPAAVSGCADLLGG